jgi:hypothetical protein
VIEEENYFNINITLRTLFSNVEELVKQKNIELIYEMDPTIPRELRGEEEHLLEFLTQLLWFVLEKTDEKEIVLSLSAPEDFLFEEFVTFTIAKTAPVKDEALDYIDQTLSSEFSKLDGQVLRDESDNIIFEIPFRIRELGFRRHYRLNDKSLIEKKALIVSKSETLARTIKKYFEYFRYEIDVHKSGDNSDLTHYDIVVTEDETISDTFVQKIIAELKRNENFKCVWIGKSHRIDNENSIISGHIRTPVTQECIKELIEQLYDPNIVHNHVEVESDDEVYVDKKIEDTPVLDVERGDENCQEKELTYSNELKSFLELFGRSDYNFRDLVKRKEYEKLDIVFEEIEKKAELIGAMELLNLVQTVRSVLYHKQYDILEIYPGKYHRILNSLKEKINYFIKG